MSALKYVAEKKSDGCEILLRRLFAREDSSGSPAFTMMCLMMDLYDDFLRFCFDCLASLAALFPSVFVGFFVLTVSVLVVLGDVLVRSLLEMCVSFFGTPVEFPVFARPFFAGTFFESACFSLILTCSEYLDLISARTFLI